MSDNNIKPEDSLEMNPDIPPEVQINKVTNGNAGSIKGSLIESDVHPLNHGIQEPVNGSDEGGFETNRPMIENAKGVENDMKDSQKLDKASSGGIDNGNDPTSNHVKMDSDQQLMIPEQHTSSKQKKKNGQTQAWQFFHNQAWDAKALQFSEKFYGDSWKTLLKIQMTRDEDSGILEKFQKISHEETYEPEMLSIEISQIIEGIRNDFLQHDKETIEDLSVFDDVVQTKGFEKFKQLFGQVGEGEDGEVVNNFRRLAMDAYEVQKCEIHRNAIEVFSWEKKYYMVTKGFSHEAGNDRMVMKIFQFTPTFNEEQAQLERAVMVEWPIVNNQACFDPSMISIIQWNQNLYYFKLKNQNADKKGADITFTLMRFDLEQLEESKVQDFEYWWPTDEEQQQKEDAKEKDKTEKKDKDDIAGNEKLDAYCAIFMKVDSSVCETEEEFVERRMIALLFDSGKGNNDQNYIFKIRRLQNFSQDLFFNKLPIPCNKQFKFQYFMEESILKRQAFALIYQERMMVVPVEISESSEVTSKEFYHYEGHDCRCCTPLKRAIATSLKSEYLSNFKVLESFNEGCGEEYKLINIQKKDMLVEMLRHFERDETLQVDIDRDCCQLVFDKRTHRYLFIYNVQFEDIKDEIQVMESDKMGNIRNSYRYEPKHLHPIIKYLHHERGLFFKAQGLKHENDYLIQKQLFSLYDNVIIEIRRHDEDKNAVQCILAYEQQKQLSEDGETKGENDDEPEKEMLVSIDETAGFMNSFKGITTDYPIQFLQLASDDRTVLPRIVRDVEKHQIIFQLFDYRDQSKDEQEESPIVANGEDEAPEGEEEDEEKSEESEDEKITRMKEKKIEERKRVIQEIPLDLSTATFNIETVKFFIQPSSSVVQQSFGQDENPFVQDFQVLVSMRKGQMFRIFQFRVYWNPKKGKGEPVPYTVSAHLVGMKMLIVRPIEVKEKIGFYPIFNDKLEINGTQIIFKTKFVIDMPNFERHEWKYSNEIAMCGYKIYYNKDDLDEDCLLMQANLAEVLNCREEFTESDHSMLLKYQIRYLMNLVPFMLDHFVINDINFSNFLQPLEVLHGQSVCDIMLHDSAYLQDVLKKVSTDEREQQSVFEFFIKELDDSNRNMLLGEDYYIPKQTELSRDQVCMNPLLRCFEAEPIFYGSVERLLAYMFSRPYSKNQSMIMMEVMSNMLSQQTPSNEFAKFFIDSPNAELNFGKVGSRFTVILDNPDLPQYSNKRVTIFEFDDELSIGSQTDVKIWMTKFIAGQNSVKKNSVIPVRHYYVDFRIQKLGTKLNQFKIGAPIDTSTISDYEVSQQLYKICSIYGKDIEFQDGTRNIIDDSYQQITYIYTIQFLLFILGYALPLFLSIFVTEAPNWQFACTLFALMTMILFFIYSLIQVFYNIRGYFKQVGNINDTLMFIFFAIYLGVKFTDQRSYLPEYVAADGDYDNGNTTEVAEAAAKAAEATAGGRRLARGGGGGRGGAGKGTTSIYGDGGAASFFEGSFLADFIVDEERQIWKIAFVGFLHTALLLTIAIKTVFFLKIYDSFQELVLVLQSCLWKVVPFGILLYFWVFIISCMFRILGADNGDKTETDKQYPLYGNFFVYTINAYRSSIGDSQDIGYSFWNDLGEKHLISAQFMSGMIWLIWLINQYVVLIFSFNFFVSIISQSYEEALNQQLVVRYTFRCERVMEASILTKLFDSARTLQTFSLSSNNNTELDKWPGFVQSIKSYVRHENIVLRQTLADSVADLNDKIDNRTDSLEQQVKDLSKKVTNVNDNINEKLDFMSEKFNEIKEIIKTNLDEDSEFSLNEIKDLQHSVNASININPGK